MNCYEAIDVMGDAVEGNLAPEARAGFHAHVAECSACRTYMDQLRITRETLAHLPPGQESSPRRSDLMAAFRRESRADA
jgi:anti-sigma factor RsiW